MKGWVGWGIVILFWFLLAIAFMTITDSSCRSRGGDHTKWIYGVSNICVAKDGRIIE